MRNMFDHIAAPAPLSGPPPDARFCESTTLDILENCSTGKK
jgi:hypothetical protein